jgi:hypothetical protein
MHTPDSRRIQTFRIPLIVMFTLMFAGTAHQSEAADRVSSDWVPALKNTIEVLPSAGKTDFTVTVRDAGLMKGLVYVVPLTELGNKVDLASYGTVTQLQAIGWYGGLMVAAKAESSKDDTATFIRIEIPKSALARRTERQFVNGMVIRMFTASKQHDLLGLTKESGQDNLVVMAGVMDESVDLDKQYPNIIKPVIYYSGCVCSQYDFPGVTEVK